MIATAGLRFLLSLVALLPPRALLNLIIPFSLLQGFPKFPLPEGEG